MAITQQPGRQAMPASGEVTRLVVLALLACRPMHGYGLRQEIELRKMDLWADVSYGSIYPRLRQLAAEGLIEPAGSAREGRRPARTTYQITAAGRRHLLELVRAAIMQPQFTAQAVDVALTFCATAASLLGSAEVAELLEMRQRALATIADDLVRATNDQVSPEPGVRALVTDLINHSRQRVAAEQTWTGHVLSQVQSDAYATPENGALTAISDRTEDHGEPDHP